MIFPSSFEDNSVPVTDGNVKVTFDSILDPPIILVLFSPLSEFSYKSIKPAPLFPFLISKPSAPSIFTDVNPVKVF